jgi:NTE family protein
VSGSTSRALVLGGGGVTGIGWEIGVLAGLASAGIELGAADVVIGSSAGAFVGVAVAAGRDLEALYESQLHPPEHELPASPSPELLDAWTEAFRAGGSDPDAVGAALGAIARANPEPVDPAARRAAVEERLTAHGWPDSLRLTAIDAESGALHIFTAASGVPLADAVRASGAVPGLWPLEHIGGRDFIDGGMVSAANAHLAAGYDRVLVVAPLPDGHGAFPGAAEDVAALGRDARALLISPDTRSLSAIGSNIYDPARRGAAAAAGRVQGAGAAAAVRSIW